MRVMLKHIKFSRDNTGLCTYSLLLFTVILYGLYEMEIEWIKQKFILSKILGGKEWIDNIHCEIIAL